MTLFDHNPAFTGTIIHGTMRPQDTVPALMDALRTIDTQGAHCAAFSLHPVPSYALEDDSAAWWDECGNDYAAELMDAITECLPYGYYCGAHEGDGADIGIWEIEE